MIEALIYNKTWWGSPNNVGWGSVYNNYVN